MSVLIKGMDMPIKPEIFTSKVFVRSFRKMPEKALKEKGE